MFQTTEQGKTPEEEISKGRQATYPKELQGNGCKGDQRTWEKIEWTEGSVRSC